MTAAAAAAPRANSRRAHRADRVATVSLWAVGAFVMVLLGAIILHFLIASIGVVSPSFIFGDPSRTTLGGVWPLLWNSIYMLVLTMLISIPLGLLAGIYMAEYSRDGLVTSTIRFAEEAISSVPSIVVGLFGLIAFVDITHWGFTALGGALALTMFNLPLMARLTEQALRAVPQDERAASLALGATRWQTIRHVVLPAARTGLITAVVLGMMRAAGEALAVQMVIGNRPTMPTALTQPLTTLTAQITLDMGNTVFGEAWNEALWTMGLVLLMISFTFVLLVRWLGRRAERVR